MMMIIITKIIINKTKNKKKTGGMEMTYGKVCDKKKSVLIWFIIFVFAYTLFSYILYNIFR